MDRGKINRPRDFAVRILGRVLSDGVALDQELDSVLDGVAPDQRAWLTDVCSGTLRLRGRLDYVLDQLALKKRPTGWLRRVLLTGAYQILGQDRVTPAKVVSECVDLIKSREGAAPANFANAVLRKLADQAQAWKKWTPRTGASDAEWAAWASVQPWMWAIWKHQHGEEWARAYAVASLERPSLWLRAREGSELLSSQEAAPDGLPPGALKVGEGARAIASGPVHQWPGFEAGDFFVQDISSQTLVHEVTQEFLKTHSKPTRSLDLCAAPGGKSAGLAWSGWEVTATDKDQARLELLRSTASRVGAGKVSVVAPESVMSSSEQYDLVWVDAPCTGSGILRRHPDVRWTKKESDIESLRATQLGLLDLGWKLTRPGGALVYSVCSVFKAEGPGLAKLWNKAQPSRTWELAPHLAPGGDGFWGGMFHKT